MESKPLATSLCANSLINTRPTYVHSACFVLAADDVCAHTYMSIPDWLGIILLPHQRFHTNLKSAVCIYANRTDRRRPAHLVWSTMCHFCPQRFVDMFSTKTASYVLVRLGMSLGNCSLN